MIDWSIVPIVASSVVIGCLLGWLIAGIVSGASWKD
jgi:hypothetical protein